MHLGVGPCQLSFQKSLGTCSSLHSLHQSISAVKQKTKSTSLNTWQRLGAIDGAAHKVSKARKRGKWCSMSASFCITLDTILEEVLGQCLLCNASFLLSDLYDRNLCLGS